MNNPQPPFCHRPRLSPLAACLAVAFSLAPATEPPAAAVCAQPAAHALLSGAPHWGFRRGGARVERPGAAHAQSVLARPRTNRPASTLPVTNCADDGSDGSLRVVVAGAFSGDVIDMSQLSCGVITLADGAVFIDVNDLTLQGPGRDVLTIDGNNADRVFSIYSNGTIAINDLTIAYGFKGGSPYAIGGCVYSYFANPYSLLTLSRVVVTSCTAGDALATYASGGGVLTYGALMLDSSIISQNKVIGGAGASYVAGGVGTLYNATIIASTVSGNSALGTVPGSGIGFGAGVDLSGTPGTPGSIIRDSTISGNGAASSAGGAYFFSPYLEPAALTATVVNSTISSNGAASNAGLEVRLANVTLQMENSTVAFNSAGTSGCGGVSLAATGNDLQSSILANNTLAAGIGADLCGTGNGAFDGANNLIMVSALSVPDDTIATDPMLEPLQDNGGPTQTHALRSQSPAIDTGNNNLALDFDQRGTGFPRVDGFQADIGAYEAHTVGDLVFSNGFDP